MIKKTGLWFIIGFLILGGAISWNQGQGAEKRMGYILPGDIKEGWRIFTVKKCGLCHAIWGEGGKGGPDLGTLPQVYVSQAQLAALMWNHGPEMWGRMSARKIPLEKINNKEMADLFAFLYFIRYMDEPGDSQKGKALVNRVCGKCHTVKKGTKENLSRWGMYTNPILWAQMMWNHSPQMEQEMKKKGVSQVEFKGSEMVDLIAYIRSVSLNIEKVYLSPGDPRRGEKLFTAKGCVQCHAAGGQYDLSRRKEFPKTLAHLTGVMWNHSGEMRKEMVIKNIPFPHLSSEEMADLVAYLFSIRYFDEPGNATNGKSVFIKKQCHLCHTKATKTADLSKLKGQISPLLMAQAMWNHGPRMLEQMRKAKIPWQKIDGMEMVDLMEYLNQGMP